MTIRRIGPLAAAIALLGALPLSAQTAQPPVSAPAFDRAVAKQAIARLASALETRFVDPAAGRAYAAMLRANLRAGAYARFTDGRALADRVSADLMAVHADGHLRLRAPGGPGPRRMMVGPDGSTPPPGPPPGTPQPAMEQAGWIAPGIAYVRFNGFPDDPKVAADFAVFLDAHADATTLIIDARSHRGGGLAEIDVLLPRIFARPATVMVMDTRASVARAEGDQPYASLVRVVGPPDISRTEHRVTPLQPASPLANAKVYYLTSGGTASAAEHLATVLKYTHRATLIGDTTAGAGNFGDVVQLPGGYSAFVPVGHSYYPGTQGWEGTGVEPDVKVAPQEALIEALTRAGVPAVEARALSDNHQPAGPMQRRPALRS